MSQYMDFFIGESKEKLICEIFTFGRNSFTYQLMHDACGPLPYGKVDELTAEDISRFARVCDAKHKSLVRQYGEAEEEEDEILRMHNSIDEKREALVEVRETKEEIKEDLEAIEYAQNFAEILSSVRESIGYYKPYKLFVGIEVPLSEENEPQNLKIS